MEEGNLARGRGHDRIIGPDHGIGLPRAKRWNYESETHAPLIVHIPEKYRAGAAGDVDEQLVSFLDLAPTVLNLVGRRCRGIRGAGVSGAKPDQAAGVHLFLP